MIIMVQSYETQLMIHCIRNESSIPFSRHLHSVPRSLLSPNLSMLLHAQEVVPENTIPNRNKNQSPNNKQTKLPLLTQSDKEEFVMKRFFIKYLVAYFIIYEVYHHLILMPNTRGVEFISLFASSFSLRLLRRCRTTKESCPKATYQAKECDFEVRPGRIC